MKCKWTLNIKQILLLLCYSSIFPLTNLLGGKMMAAGIMLSLPFLWIAWIGGMFFVWAIGTEKVYLCGAFISILLQTWLVMIIWHNAQRKRMDQAKTILTVVDEIVMHESKKNK
jgi:hypothetical protein